MHESTYTKTNNNSTNSTGTCYDGGNGNYDNNDEQYYFHMNFCFLL